MGKSEVTQGPDEVAANDLGSDPSGALLEPLGEPVRVVGIASSAGGLEALDELLRCLDPEPPLTYVIAQHSDPHHPSALVELLARETPLEVLLAADGQHLEPRVIYVAPPDHDVRILGNTVKLDAATSGIGPTPRADVLFRSMADSWGDRSVGIVLSGTGNDGAQGVIAIRSAGGLTIAQEPSSARFAGMPESAIGSAAVDLVLPPSEIGAALMRVGAAAPAAPGEPTSRSFTDPSSLSTEDLLSGIVSTVRGKTGLDFSGYKESTLRRQLERRLAITGSKDLFAYLNLLNQDAAEAQAVVRAMEIEVTSFFRDPHAWQALREPLTELISGVDPLGLLRIWVPGCATGEEVYTAAMLAAELMGSPAKLAQRLKVFATDISEHALEIARQGVYRDEVVTAIPDALRERWMHEVPHGWEISQELRETVVFARHNIIADPGFPRIHLITLRNLLIYFRPELQSTVIAHCHQSMAPGGLLMLGTSERIIDGADLFDSVDTKHRIYRRRAGAAKPIFVVPWSSAPPLPQSAETTALLGQRTALREALVRRFAPPSLVIDQDQQVVEVVGDVSPWCWVAEGQPSRSVLGLLREGLRPIVRDLLVQARGGSTVERDVAGPNGAVRISIRALSPDNTGLSTVSFYAIDEDLSASEVSPGPDRPAAIVESELESTRFTLQATIEELGASNEELQALNEELQASTEELQAAAEELQAANEELEVTNEELEVTNAELQERSDSLTQSTTDLENLETSLTSGMVLVDTELRITRFTPLAVRLFPLIPSDYGRPVTAIPTVIPIPDLEVSLNSALLQRTSSLTTVSGGANDFIVAYQPYLGSRGEVRGAIIVITDATELTTAQREARRALRLLTRSTDALQEVMWLRDSTGNITFVNAMIESVIGLSRERVLADPSLLRSGVHLQDQARVSAHDAASGTNRSLVYRITRPDGAARWISEQIRQFPADEIDSSFEVGTSLDITDAVIAQQQAQILGATLVALRESEVTGSVLVDDSGRIVSANSTISAMSGHLGGELIGMPAASLLVPGESIGGGLGPSSDRNTEIGTGVMQRVLVGKDGARQFVTIESRPVLAESGHAGAHVITIHNFDRLRTFTSANIAADPFDRETGLMTRSRFRTRVTDEFARLRRSGISFALLWIDLDGFKQINDGYGHQVGDLVLAETARRLLNSARRDDSVARMGGDEFAILVTGIEEFDRLSVISERVLVALRDPIAVADTLLYTSGSIGVALAPTDGADPDSLLHAADTAMYAAKGAGGDRIDYFQPAMNQAAERRAAGLLQLSNAIRGRDFTIAYQPILDAQTGAVRALECLLRQQDRERLIPAGEFMEIAVASGRIRALGLLALELIDADLQSTAGKMALDGRQIAVNLSADELNDRDTFEWLAAWEPPAGGYPRMTIEITETSLFRQGSRAVETISLLRRLGASLSIDDFGVGYSNLALLGELKPDVIKIDRSLLLGVQTSPRGQDLLDAAVRMARAFGAEVVLEGVENLAQEQLAQRLEVDSTQGFLRARPMPLEELTVWLRDHVESTS